MNVDLTPAMRRNTSIQVKPSPSTIAKPSGEKLDDIKEMRQSRHIIQKINSNFQISKQGDSDDAEESPKEEPKTQSRHSHRTEAEPRRGPALEEKHRRDTEDQQKSVMTKNQKSIATKLPDDSKQTSPERTKKAKMKTKEPSPVNSSEILAQVPSVLHEGGAPESVLRPPHLMLTKNSTSEYGAERAVVTNRNKYSQEQIDLEDYAPIPENRKKPKVLEYD